MDLPQLEAVVAVADHGGFGAAADALHLTQPALSRRIATLERELGVLLFARVGRGVRLTDAGRAVLVSARRTLHESRQVLAAVDDVTGLGRGRIDVAGLPSMLATYLVPVVGAFRAAHPGIELTIDGAADTPDLLAMVASARCDVGLADLPVHHAGLRTIAVADQELMAVFPPGTELAGRDGGLPVVTVAELRSHPLVMLPRATSGRTLADELFAGSGEPHDVMVTTNLRDLLVPLVLAGAGIALVPDRVAEGAREAGAVIARVTPAARRGVGFVLREGPLTPAVAAFVELATRLLTDPVLTDPA